jgi:peptidoglycan hydrolase-like protein with peptidoglycan-binding domain
VELTRDEKLKLQLMRVQIKLTSLGLYSGPIDGARNVQTVEALKLFQSVKGLRTDGLMSTATLNALGVPAAN